MVFGPPTRRESERRGFEDLVEKAGGLSITREQKQLLLKKLNEEIESTQKKFIESKGLPKEVFAALDAEYADFSEKLGDTAGQVVKEAIEGRLGLTAGFDALYRTTDTDAIDSFGEAKVKLDEKATELLTDVRSFHLAIVDGDVAQASSKLDDILDDRESLALMDQLAILTGAYGRGSETVTNLRSQVMAIRNLDRTLKRQYMSLKGDDTIAMMFKARDLAKAYEEAAEAIEQRLERNRNSNDDLNVNLGLIAMDPEVITQYGERLKEYEDIITVDFIKEIYLKNPALRPDAIKNVDFDTVKEQIMEEVFATVKLDADAAQVEKQAKINATKAVGREAKRLVEQYKSTGQFVGGVAIPDSDAVIAAAEQKAKEKIKAAEAAEAARAAAEAGRIAAKEERDNMREQRDSAARGMQTFAQKLEEERAASRAAFELSAAEIARIDADLDRLASKHGEVGEIATRFDDAQETVEELKDLRVDHFHDDVNKTNRFTREEKADVLLRYQAAVKARFDAMAELSEWKRRNLDD